MNHRIAAIFGVGALVWGLGTHGALAAPTSALGYVDAQKVFQNYKAAQAAQARFRQEAEAYQNELAADQAKLEAARSAKKSPAEINKMQQKFENELQPKKNKVEALDRQLSGKIKKQIEAVIAQVARSKGIATVVDKQVILYGGVDLTHDVIQKLNH